MALDPSQVSGRDLLIAALTGPDEPEPQPQPGIKLVAIDLDGTLLDDTKQVSQQTADALRCLPERGVKMVIASARPPRSVRQFHTMLGLDTLSIHYNGALIWDEPKKQVVDHTPMDGALVLEIINGARTIYPCLLYTSDAA